eukprot:TRINITY_DN4829_c0_g1_i2.p1 TRINITY_DN4829_c0_g1~~TRINITY_DN4829_c0_g1_i2.p1  ORF type:complete len:383 (-),score=78.72 TRINITY_DN4829_c0_g1_i2:1761-2909(-)
MDQVDRTLYSAISLCGRSIYPEDDPHRKLATESFRRLDEDIEFDRALGSIFGLVVGDALGAPLEFSPVQYGTTELHGFEDINIWNESHYNHFRLEPGQWTDDSSMSFCLADSLILNNGLNCKHLRMMFLNWWQFGYANAFVSRSSVGLGGNINISFGDFIRNRGDHTTAGDKQTSGNGSIMRLAPIAIFYRNDNDALYMAEQQSLSTHQGIEAAECARLLAFLIIKGLKGDGTKEFLEDLSDFTSNVYSIQCLVNSLSEDICEHNQGLDIRDRNWNWKSSDYRFAPIRTKQNPGYIGSYAMDNISMALHCVWTTSSFEEAVLKSANMRGDADSVAAVVGQICGAIYGVSSIPTRWLNQVRKWDLNDDILLRGYKLFHRNQGT